MGSKPPQLQSEQMINLQKHLILQLTFPKISERFEKAEFFYKAREMKVYLPIENEKILIEWEKSILSLSENQLKQYVLLPKQYEFQKQGICGSVGIAKITYDYFPYSLQGEIENRKKSLQNDQFTEPELWKILFTLLKTCHLIHTDWKKVGDIRPKNIFYNQQKQLRVSCLSSYPKELSNYQKFIFQKQPTYISPEEMHDIKMGRIDTQKLRNSKQQIIQGESWSIGITLLHVMLLFNFQKIYDPLKLEINFKLLQQKLMDLDNYKKISVTLKNIILGMIQEIPQRRLLSSQLYLNYLIHFQQNIMSLKPFQLTNLNQQITQLMKKKTLNSLIGTVWKSFAFQIPSQKLQSLTQNEKQNKAKETLLQQLQKFSEIPPKNSQVSMRESIRLGGSRTKVANSISKRRVSQTSNESFHTVNSLRTSKKSGLSGNYNKIENFSLENRFSGLRVATSGSHFSPTRNSLIENKSDKFTTPLQQSSYFLQTIQPNEKSFDFNSLGLFSERYWNSQTFEDKQYTSKPELEKPSEQTIPSISANFKKQKDKFKN